MGAARNGIILLLALVTPFFLPSTFSPLAPLFRFVVPRFFQLFEQNKVPDFLTRIGVRGLLGVRLGAIPQNKEDHEAAVQAFIQDLKTRPIAIHTGDANKQHYEVDSRFYKMVLGQHLKYSSALYPNTYFNSTFSYEYQSKPQASAGLDAAELGMLQLYMVRAQIATDSQFRILDLGCGWGSLTLFLAAYCPRCSITALSNSETQRAFILEEAKTRGLKNIEVITADITTFNFPPTLNQFDRILSIEMFEHMKNYDILLHKIAPWLKNDGKLFIHIFTHKDFPYHFEVQGEDDWMSEHFFTGGTMPSANLLLHFNQDFRIVNQWVVNGRHYALTSEAWLQKLDQNQDKIQEIFSEVYGEENKVKWFARWRGFFIAVSELFNYRGGNEWFVSHYLFEKQR